VVQHAYNVENGVEPYTIKKEVRETIRSYEVVKELAAQYGVDAPTTLLDDGTPLRLEDIPLLVADLERKMKDLAKAMEFEKAAEVRDEIAGLRKLAGLGDGRKIGQEKRRLPGRRK
jgi:excinuclease ABC subunit B